MVKAKLKFNLDSEEESLKEAHSSDPIESILNDRKNEDLEPHRDSKSLSPGMKVLKFKLDSEEENLKETYSSDPIESTLNDRKNENLEPHRDSKSLSPGMKVLLREHIDNSILEMKSRLQEFISFVEEVQHQVPSEWQIVTVSPLKSTSDASLAPAKPPLRDPISVDSRPENSALRDAFYIVKKLLLRTAKLITEMALNMNPDDEHGLDTQSSHFDYYYAQYVFQLTYFLLRIFSEQVNHFSEKLRQETNVKSLGMVASIEDEIRIDSFPSFSFVQKKDQKLSPRSTNEHQSSSQRELPGQSDQKHHFPTETNQVFVRHEAQPTRTFDKNIIKALADPNLSNTELRKRIHDSLELLIFLSEKMLYWLQISVSRDNKVIHSLKPTSSNPYVCSECTIKLTRAQTNLCDPCRTTIQCYLEDLDFSKIKGFNCSEDEKQQFQSEEPGTENKRGILKYPPSDWFTYNEPDTHLKPMKQQPSTEKKVKLSDVDSSGSSTEKNTPSFTDRDIGPASSSRTDELKDRERQERIHILGLFNIKTFADRLKEELAKYMSRSASQIPDDSEQYEPSSIMNKVIQSFKDSSVKGDVSVHRQFVQQMPDSAEKDTRTELHSDVSAQDKNLNQILKKFAEESTRIAVQIVEKRREARKAAEGTPKTDPDDETQKNLPETLQPNFASKEFFTTSTEPTTKTTLSKGKSDLKSSVSKRENLAKNGQEFLLSDFTSFDNMPLVSGLFPERDNEETGLAEVREVDVTGDVSVSTVEYIDEKDPQDQRWERNILKNLAMVAVTQTARENEGPVLEVHYDRREQAPRHSLAETHLNIVKDLVSIQDTSGGTSSKHSSTESFSLEPMKEVKRVSSETHLLQDKQKSPKQREEESSIKDVRKRKQPTKFEVINKLWRLYDDLQKKGLCNGPPLILKVREYYLLDDAFSLLMTPSRTPLNHYRFIQAYITDNLSYEPMDFESDVREEQTEDFYYLVTEQLFSPDFKSLFDYPSSESKFLYPNPGSPSHPRWFEFAGVMLALSIIHQNPVRVKFPLCFFKCLLDRPLKMEDLEELDPLLYERLILIKESDISSRRISFSVRDRLGGESVEHDLNENDSTNTLVTEENKYQYIEKCLKWRLAEFCLEQFKEIRRGFVSVLDPRLLLQFSEEELQELCFKPLDEIASSDDISIES